MTERANQVKAGIIAGIVSLCLSLGGNLVMTMKLQENHELRITANERMLEESALEKQKLLTLRESIAVAQVKVNYNSQRLDSHAKNFVILGNEFSNLKTDNAINGAILTGLNDSVKELRATTSELKSIATILAKGK